MDEGIRYFDILFVKCGPIGWALWALSVVTVAIIVKHFISIRRAKLIPAALAEQVKALLARRDHGQVMELVGRDESMFAKMLHAALSRSSRGYGAMERAMEEAGEHEATCLLRRVEWLNLIGNVGPMGGLLGTVWGMILAFFTIVQTGGIPHPGELAGAIGTALVTTLEGLMIAIPALAVYAVMRNRIDLLSGEAMVLCQDLISSAQPVRGGVGAAGQDRKGTYVSVGRQAVKADGR